MFVEGERKITRNEEPMRACFLRAEDWSEEGGWKSRIFTASLHFPYGRKTCNWGHSKHLLASEASLNRPCKIGEFGPFGWAVQLLYHLKSNKSSWKELGLLLDSVANNHRFCRTTLSNWTARASPVPVTVSSVLPLLFAVWACFANTTPCCPTRIHEQAGWEYVKWLPVCQTRSSSATEYPSLWHFVVECRALSKKRCSGIDGPSSMVLRRDRDCRLS